MSNTIPNKSVGTTGATVAADNAPEQPSVKRDGEYILIRLPRDDAHSFMVALAECPCRAVKSNATREIRVRLSKALARLISPKPVQRHPLHNNGR